MKMKKYVILVAIFILQMTHLSAQDTLRADSIYWRGKREIGLNFTPLISSLIPFNLSTHEEDIIGIIYKKYYGKTALKINFGVQISEGTDRDFVHLSIGYEKRRTLTKQFFYTSGWMATGELESLIQTDTGIRDVFGLGVSKFYGFEYHINQRFFLSTEAQLKVFFSDQLKIRFQPPISIFANVRL